MPGSTDECTKSPYKSLHVDIPAITRVVFAVIAIQFHHLPIRICIRQGSVVGGFIVLQVVNSKGCSTDPTPWIMGSTPRLAIHKRLAATPLRRLVFYKFSKIRTHEVVARTDIEFSEKIVYGPGGILYV